MLGQGTTLTKSYFLGKKKRLFIKKEEKMSILLFAIILVIWCLIVARLEVETEGKDGWAKNLPTAKYKLDEKGKLWHKPFGEREYREPICSSGWQNFYKIFIKILGGREFTVYHRVVDAMHLFVAHLVVYLFFFKTAVWWILEIRAIATLLLFWSIEDTLWFFVNPFYGPRGYKPEYIPWHARDWWFFAPKGVIILFLLGVGLFWISFF